MSSAARRNEVARYRLEMIITAADKVETAAPTADAVLGPAIRKALDGDWKRTISPPLST
jgi:hypothetical protein